MLFYSMYESNFKSYLIHQLFPKFVLELVILTIQVKGIEIEDLNISHLENAMVLI